MACSIPKSAVLKRFSFTLNPMTSTVWVVLLYYIAQNQPFTAPTVIPFIKYFCRQINNIAMGRTDMTIAAIAVV